MCAKIRRLDEVTINQIAAGEVVENPASVIKELIENSLDAEAQRIEITTKAGGRQLIRISDDGIGMNLEEAMLALERHATSKISNVNDLNSLSTMGFRGEALPSIAAISHMTLTTSISENEGVSIALEGGKVLSTLPALRKQGTTIEIRSLFYNVPARKKFQKSISADSAEMHKNLIAIVLANPGHSFFWSHDDKVVFDLKASSLAERAQLIFDEKFTDVISVDIEKENYSIKGLIGSPASHFSNRLKQFLFINNRPVISPLISKAVREGYGPRLPNNRYPFFVLNLCLSMKEVDINVHPQKKEVRFSNEKEIYGRFFQAVETSLQKNKQQHVSPSISDKRDGNSIDGSNILKTPFTGYQKAFDRPYEGFKVFDIQSSNGYSSKREVCPSTDSGILLDPRCSILAIFEGYALVSGKILNGLDLSFDEGIYFIDLLRASRRVHYEAWSKESDLEVQTQQLLFPIALKLSHAESLMLNDGLKELNSLGFGIRLFGLESFIVDSIPPFLEHEQVKNLILDLINEPSLQNKKKGSLQHYRLHILKYLKSSVTTVEQASELILKLLRCQERNYCPFGQKIFSLITVEELRRKF